MGEAAALLAAFTWSATSVVMASLSQRVSPAAMSTLRLCIASLLLPIVLLISGQAGQLAEAPASALIAMVGSGLLAYAIGDTMYIAALKHLGVQRAFPITMGLFILLTVIGGILLLGEEFGLLQVAGGVLVGAGAWLIVSGEARDGATGSPRRALLLIVGVGVFWSCATLWLAKGRGDLDAVSASMIRTPAGAAGMLAYTLAVTRADLVAPLRNARDFWTLATIGVVGTLFGSLLYVYAVGEAGPGRTSILNASSPLLALPLSIIFLKERLTTGIALGTVIAVAGIVLVVA